MKLLAITVILFSATFAKGDGSCGTKNWPDLDNSVVCGECKALIDGMKSKYGNCKAYCQSIGRSCVGGWEEKDNSCTVKSIQDCQHDFGGYTSDAICQCSETVVAEPVSSGFSVSAGYFDWNAAKQHCTDKGMILASVASADEWEVVKELTANVVACPGGKCSTEDWATCNFFWLGGMRTGGLGGVWSWLDGSPFDYRPLFWHEDDQGIAYLSGWG